MSFLLKLCTRRLLVNRIKNERWGVNLNKFNYYKETDRLVIRPLEKGDYTTWLTEFENRLPSQHKYDEGKIDMSICTKEWFEDLVDNHQRINQAIYFKRGES